MADPETGSPPAPGTSKLPLILAGVNTLLIVGVLAFVMLRGGHPAKAADGEHGKEPAGEQAGKEGEHGKEGAGPGPSVKLPDFTIHLRNPEADRYARISFEVEVGMELDKEKVNARLPQIRDAFIAYLSDRSLEELRGSEGLNRVKTALVDILKQVGAPVRALYITDFVVQ
ncbi:flagellar basal body-associated FliL family protein [Anaeromyxobacter paludicola]|uniref:Flagellar protein FliL n=1 Tax=Anaeromyxobacter paludicola TaxID=2918171 RepID=A0ABN6N619_9BACT|nr:flagellar basal body-associated FliL family protein [Anaeromyxobacter paludicola]BDG07990.1 flagellar basal body-associated protein FliL [Anaeromyxobacter paludicola]